MKRLVFIRQDILGGVNSFVSNLSYFLAQANIDHLVLIYGYNNGITDSIQPMTANSTKIGLSKFGSVRSACHKIATLIGEDDILICNDSLELFTVNYLGLRNPVVFVLHGDLEHYNSILKEYEGVIDKVFCVSNGLKEKYSRLYPGLPFEVFHPLVKNVEYGPRLIAEPDLKGIFIGRFEYMKGADTFGKVVNMAVRERLPVKWKVYTTTQGLDKELMAALDSAVEVKLDLSNDEVLLQIENADLLIFPSRSEGFGMAILEGMKRGVIPIARDIPIGIPDMIISGETGYLGNNEEDIVGIIRQLAGEPALLHSMKQKVVAFSNANFNFNKEGDLFVNMIGELISGPLGKKTFLVRKMPQMQRVMPEFCYRLLRCFKNSIRK